MSPIAVPFADLQEGEIRGRTDMDSTVLGDLGDYGTHGESSRVPTTAQKGSPPRPLMLPSWESSPVPPPSTSI